MIRSLPACLLVCLLVAQTAADVVLVKDRLSLDALVWVDARWRSDEAMGFVQRDFVFYRFWAPVGLTGRIGKVASLRISFDAGVNQRALDIYADCNWPSGFGFRMGQFTMPVGVEALTPPRELKLIEYSLVKNAWKPFDPRDVGLMGSFRNRSIDLALAIVNGNGKDAWLQDDNGWKDACARVVLRHFEQSGLLFGLRSYHGRMGTDGTVFRNYALELSVTRGRLATVCELQDATIGSYRHSSFYIQAFYRVFSFLEPGARYQMSFSTGSVRNVGVAGGLNFPIRNDELRVQLNYDYRRQGAPGIELDFTNHRMLLQIQAAL